MTASGKSHGAMKHWFHQRLTAIANLPLMLWLAWSVVHMRPMSHAAFTHWLTQPCHAALMIAAMLSISYHAALGTQVIAEDYIHDKSTLKTTLCALRLYFAALAVVCIACVVKIAMGH